ncbi:bacillithiol biosynthesis deacetylase BshB1 [Ignavibacterium sp.]|uniref:bacillithiol biosynthesis deacetylase BshB1 n=1 Tax=Ignavibacterium sp. TaxID=2651167 RepID=UPI002208F2A5|nr:bacillithiol biosynthesis deacetylase BshB1 [Ignavibacterium sp.]BDQ01496.1 MAG: bacillithiol biosynthesis deacetylase BshB1 [Ignavibacterium sp.]
MHLDVLVFSAHPDDAELSMGGTVALLSKNNIKVGLIDLTKGEMGTRGTAETRQREAFNAAITLKAAMRENLEIPDGNIQLNKENLLKVIITIRKYRPSIVFAPYFNDRHPDHIDASQLIKRAVFYSGLAKIKTFDREVPQQQFRPDRLFYFMQTYTFEPTFIVDISETFEQKMKAIACYETQFHNPKSTEPETFISRPEFINYIRSRAEFYGFQIHKRYGEPFFCEEKLELNLLNFFNKNQ